MAAYLEAVGDDPAWWLERQLTHPGWLLLDANAVLVQNVRLGPWIHVGSEIGLRRMVYGGQPLETRAIVTDRYDRKGHRFVELDVVTFAAGEVAMRVRHTAIWHVREHPVG
jgi:hypothetical protein